MGIVTVTEQQTLNTALAMVSFDATLFSTSLQIITCPYNNLFILPYLFV